MFYRPRRLRRTHGIRRMVSETRLSTEDLIAPLFVTAGEQSRQAIPSMPGYHRLGLAQLLKEASTAFELGVPAIVVFPVLEEKQKDSTGSEGRNPEGLYPTAIRALKEHLPELVVITDVALDPYSSDGHDGVVRGGSVVNDETVELLAQMAVVQAEAGADVIAPSDMMDGRIGAIRRALDGAGYSETAILSYTAKYASAFYGPFRDALDSAPSTQQGIPLDKRGYQMDPANGREALRELHLDLAEGADLVMVKPGLPFMDILWRLRQETEVPVAAYNVSGEYSMLKAAAERDWLDEPAVVLETLTGLKRAGADLILTYHAFDAARWLHQG